MSSHLFSILFLPTDRLFFAVEELALEGQAVFHFGQVETMSFFDEAPAATAEDIEGFISGILLVGALVVANEL